MIRCALRSSGSRRFRHCSPTSPAPTLLAEVRAHPSGRFLYSTNRGHNGVAMFEIEPDSASLEPERNNGI
jgi:hypothetical protein